MSSKGRPKSTKPIQELTFTTFQEDITLFKNGLIDSLEDDDNYNKDIIQKFLDLDVWQQNLYIVYVLHKKTYTLTALADLLQVNKLDLMRTIKSIKNELTSR